MSPPETAQIEQIEHEQIAQVWQTYALNLVENADWHLLHAIGTFLVHGTIKDLHDSLTGHKEPIAEVVNWKQYKEYFLQALRKHKQFIFDEIRKKAPNNQNETKSQPDILGLNGRIATLRGEIRSALFEKAKILTDESDKLALIAGLHAEKQHLAQDILAAEQRQQVQLADLHKRIAALEQQISAAASAHDATLHTVHSAEIERAQLQQKLETILAETRETQERIDRVNSDIHTLIARVAEAEEHTRLAEHELAEAERRKAEAEKIYAEQLAKLAEIKSQRDETLAAVSNLERETLDLIAQTQTLAKEKQIYADYIALRQRETLVIKEQVAFELQKHAGLYKEAKAIDRAKAMEEELRQIAAEETSRLEAEIALAGTDLLGLEQDIIATEKELSWKKVELERLRAEHADKSTAWQELAAEAKKADNELQHYFQKVAEHQANHVIEIAQKSPKLLEALHTWSIMLNLQAELEDRDGDLSSTARAEIWNQLPLNIDRGDLNQYESLFWAALQKKLPALFQANELPAQPEQPVPRGSLLTRLFARTNS